MTVPEAIIELRQEFPAGARQLECACELLESDELSIELVVMLAIFAGRAANEIMSAGASLDGIIATMQNRNHESNCDKASNSRSTCG